MVKRKDYGTAIVLNLFVPGAGYIYAGRVFLGVVVLTMAFGPLLFAAFYLPGIPEAVIGWTGFLALIGAADGYLTVKRNNDLLAEVVRLTEQAKLKTCPFCAEQIQLEARVCKHCRRDLP